jgi:hypothetical protein
MNFLTIVYAMCNLPAILILMLEADFSTPTKNVITLIMTE